MTYRPPIYFQLDGTRFQHANCVPSTATMLIDRATVGRRRVPAWRLRNISGDTSGGLSYTQVAEAAETAADVQLDVRVLDSRGKLRDLVASGRGVGVIIDCSVTRYTANRTGTFTGLHSVYLSEYRWVYGEKPHGEFVYEDPGTSAGYKVIPAGLLYRACEKAGGGSIWTLSTRDTEGVTRTARLATKKRAKPRRDSAIVGQVRVGQSVVVPRTVNGGSWRNDDGSQSKGWHLTKSQGYVKGESLR